MSGLLLLFVYQITKKGKLKMDLIEFRAYVQAQREASKAQALSVLTATMSQDKGKEN